MKMTQSSYFDLISFGYLRAAESDRTHALDLRGAGREAEGPYSRTIQEQPRGTAVVSVLPPQADVTMIKAMERRLHLRREKSTRLRY